MRFYATRPDLMSAMQLKARDVTRRHTWEQRAEELLDFIRMEIL